MTSANTATAAGGHIQMIAPQDLVPSPRNPRGAALDQDHVADLAASMAEVGILQPLVVRPQGESYEIVCGHCRHAAALQAGLEAVPCIVRELTDAQALEAALIENSQRRDVHPLDESAGLCALVDMGLSAQDLADRLGRTSKWVRDRLALRTLTDRWLELLRTHQIALRSAVALALLPEERQEEIAKQVLSAYRPSLDVESIRGVIRNYGRRPLSSALWPLDAVDVGGRGACTTCPMRSDVQPDLWQEAEEVDCLDRKCWSEKVDVHVGQLVASGAKVVGQRDYSHVNTSDRAWMLHDGESSSPPPRWSDLIPDAPVLYYREGDRLDAYIRPADIAPALRAAGHEVLADKYERRPSTSSGSGQTKKRKMPSAREMVELIAALVAKLEAYPTAHMDVVAQLMIKEAGGAQQRRALKRRGVEKFDIESATPGQLWGYALEALLGRSIETARAQHSYGLRSNDPLVELCRRFEIPMPKHLVMSAAEERRLAERWGSTW